MSLDYRKLLIKLSLYVPPFVSTMFPIHVKDCTSYRTYPCSVIGLLFLLLIFMISVLSLFTFSSNVAAVVSIRGVFNLACVCGYVKKSHIIIYT